MNLQTRKIILAEYLLEIEDENLITKFEQFLQNQQNTQQNIQQKNSPITKEELIARAKKSEEDIENGNVYSIEEIEKISKKW